MRNFIVPLFVTLLAGCAQIDPGNIGVRTNSMTGEIHGDPLPAGFHLVGLWTNVFEFPTVVDNIELNDFKVNTREGQEISVDIRVQYKPLFAADNDNVVKLYERYKKPFHGTDGLVETRWQPVIQQAAGYAFSQFGVIDVYTSRGARVAAVMKHILKDGLHTADIDIDGIGDDFVTLETVAISDIGLPDAIKKSVEMKAQIEQETLAAQQQLEKARAEAERSRIIAQGDADSKLIRARGEAQARTALGISAEMYTRIEVEKIRADAIKNAKNLVIVPNNSILDTRTLAGK